MIKDEGYPVEWVPTPPDVYRAIYAAYEGDLAVFSTHSCMEGCFWHGDGDIHMHTSWGFKGAEQPLIRSERDGEQWAYYIAKGMGVYPEED